MLFLPKHPGYPTLFTAFLLWWLLWIRTAGKEGEGGDVVVDWTEWECMKEVEADIMTWCWGVMDWRMRWRVGRNIPRCLHDAYEFWYS